MKITKLLVLGAMLFVGSSAKAVDGDVWKAPTLPAEVALENGGTYYFYNVGSGLFFTQGNAWGTQASVGTSGLKVKVEETANAGVYTLTDYVKTQSAWKMWWFIDNQDDPTMYVDYNGQANYLWTIVEAGEKTYRIGPAASNPFAFGEGVFVGLDTSTDATRTYLTWNNTADSGAFIDWKLIPETEGDAYDAAYALYGVAQELKAVLDEAEKIGADVAAQVAVYNNTASTSEELTQAIADAKDAIAAKEKENAKGELDKATVDNPVDATAYIVNPNYADGAVNGWSLAPDLEKHGDVYTAEFYNKVYDMNQEISGLPAGVYGLNLVGFYRDGGYSGAGYDRYLNGTDGKNALVYATSGDATYTHPLASIYSDAPETSFGNNTEVPVTSTDGKTVYVPNMRESAQIYFNNGLYANNTVLFASDGDTITIGLKKTVAVSTDWTPFNNWTLKYYGNAAAAYQMLLNEQLKDKATFTVPEGTIYTESYLTDYQTAVANGTTASSKEEIDGILAKISAALEVLEQNITLWKQYATAAGDASTLAAKTNEYDPAYLEDLGDYFMDYNDDVKAKSLTNEQLTAKIAEIEAAIAEAQIHPKSNADMTKLLKNPGFDEGAESGDFSTRFPGWQGTFTNAGAARTVSSCAEFWNTESFDMYQVLENVPKGVYEISVQGFYRYLRDGNAWSAYLTKDPNTLEENIPTYIYMNDNRTPFTNVFGDPRRDELQLSPDGLNAPAMYDGVTDYVSVTDEETGNVYFFPNNMPSSAACFAQGMYTQKAYGLVAQDGDTLRLGVIGSSNQGGDSWVIFDNFQLTYKGFDAEIIKPVLETNIEKSKNALAGYIGKDVAAALTKAIEEGEAALTGDGDAMFAALSAIFATNRAVTESKAKFNALVSANESLAAAYVEATVCALSTIQEAKTLNETITANLEAGVYNDEDVDDLLAQIDAMKKKLGIPEGMEKATDENPVDASGFIVNAKYANNAKDGWTCNLSPAVEYEVCELYEPAAFDYYQEVEGLPAGTYELSVQAFYRHGDANTDNAEFTANPDENNNLFLYVRDASVAVERLAAEKAEYTSTNISTDAETGNKTAVAMDAATAGKQGWAYTWIGDPTISEDGESATGIRVANGMLGASEVFADGKYASNSIIFKVEGDEKVRIGVKKETEKVGAEWTIWGNWTLMYYGTNSTKETGISAVAAAPVAKTEFFNLNGARIQKPTKGVAIVKQTLGDGSVKVSKVIIK